MARQRFLGLFFRPDACAGECRNGHGRLPVRAVRSYAVANRGARAANPSRRAANARQQPTQIHGDSAVTARETPDATFFDRADAHIHLANRQCSDAGRGQVSASLLYAASRFNAWNSACNARGLAPLREQRERMIEYFVSEYRKMLTENIDDYIANHDTYMRPD
jgi:hypothetical protein